MTTKTMTYWRATDQVTTDADEAMEAVEATEPEQVEAEEAEGTLADAAIALLTEIAGTYHGLITHTDLAARLQRDTGLTTRSNASTWTSRVLARVAALDVEADRPPLTALVVDKADGTVGEPYEQVLRLTGQSPIADELQREKHAAAARMECYRWGGATIPSGGGNPALSPRYDMVVTRDRRKARQEAQPNVCPTCFMAVPPTGVCDNCG